MEKTGFEKKIVDGKPNPKYVDALDEDKPIANQKFVCISFISPDKLIKQKEIFFFEEFLKNWDFHKLMDKSIQFINFMAFKYNLSFDELTKDFKEFVDEERVNLSKSNLTDDYKTYLDNHEEELQKKFDVLHQFQTNTRGVKVRGSYPSQEEAELRCKLLREIDPYGADILVGEVGKWLAWDPESYKTGRVEYLEEELNQLMNDKKKNEAEAKTAFEQRVKEAKQQAIEDNKKKAEKSGNVLSQTIDEQGNLIGVNNASSTQEFALGEPENISTADICAELFEGDNIVVGKSDYGESQLKAGLFGRKSSPKTA
jgi:hypothetical protein